MPTYEYACTDCGTHVEVVQRMSDEPLTVCGFCGGRMRKVFHPAGILLKGTGFYKTDNRAKSTSAASGDGAKKDTGKKDTGKKDTGKSSEPATTGSSKSKEKSA